MPYLLPFANMSFLLMGLIRELLKTEMMQTSMLWICFIGCRMDAYYRNLFGRFGYPRQQDFKINDVFCITYEGDVIRGSVIHGKLFFDGSLDSIYRAVIFYTLTGVQYACMFLPHRGEDIHNIPNLNMEKPECIRNPQILSCHCLQTFASDGDVTEIMNQYLGPMKNFHDNVSESNLDPRMILDSRGSFVFDLDWSQSETDADTKVRDKEDYPTLDIIMMAGQFKFEEKHINLLDLDSIKVRLERRDDE